MKAIAPTLKRGLLLTLVTCAGCGGPSEPSATEPSGPQPAAQIANSQPAPDAAPHPPAAPGEGPAKVVETYYALIGAHRYDEARRLRWDHDTLDAKAFAANFEPYADYRATIGMPSEIQGAAGSLYVEVPAHLYGRLKTGKPFGTAGTITLRRVNDVAGASEEERRWRIYTSN